MSGFEEEVTGGSPDASPPDGNGDEIPQLGVFAEFYGSGVEFNLIWRLGTWDHKTEEGSVGRIFASPTKGPIRVFDRETREQVAQFNEAGTEVTSVVVIEGPQGEILLASGYVDGSVEIWSASSNALLSHLPGPFDEDPGVVALRTYQDSSVSSPHTTRPSRSSIL
jgi:WD40 repeat protein